MELKEFIENTLVDIVEGSANKDYTVQKVDFNVVLGVNTGTEKATKRVLQVIFPSIGFRTANNKLDINKNSEQTTVHFTVPIKLPIKRE